ncbi:MAG: cyanophycin synthetase [Thermosynechococcaceae cyanobacterium MS004]|nr:cyanophycin synthetase [Thermosynechococcaceae cyanobacterium MS004]
MKILQTQTLRGPNYWSIRRSKLIVVRLDLEELADRPSNTIPGFYEGLIAALPSLEEHFCSPGCRGGFLSRVREGTMMGHILEHVALELQTLADMPVGFGRTRETATPGIYQVVFEYQDEAAGRYAARAALRLCQSIVQTGSYPTAELAQDLEDLKGLRVDATLGASTEALVREAEALGIPWMQLETCDLFQFGYGKYQKRIQAALTSHSNVLGVELACDKERTKNILSSMGIPVPLGKVVFSFSELEEAISSLGGYPIVIKPLDGNHGRGITINIQSAEQAEVAYDRARDVSKGVIVEHFYQGRDHRILVVNHKVVAVAERVPAHVIGDGVATIAELVAQENQDERRGAGHDNMLTHIELDDATDELLRNQGFILETVLEVGQVCYLRATANLSTGGIAIDRTDDIHPETLWLAERVSRIIDLDVAGIDVITTDITKTLAEADGVIVEVNAAPGLRMHISPSQGVGRNVAAPILRMLFPPGTPTRVPIVAVTGTNGKTTTTRLIAHIFSQVHESVGFTTTDGIYIGGHLIEKGDTTGPQSAQLILQDPTVDIAVLETARGGILRSGLAFESCDVGVVLNVAADHLGLGDINTIDQMARVKGVIAEAVHADGYAVLNAEDDRVAAMADLVRGKVAYFSMDPDNPRVRSQVQRGGIAAVLKDGYIVILQQDWIHRIEKIEQVPLTLGGRAPFMIANALAASLAAFVQGVGVEQIRAGLRSFKASAQQTPGRMNLFNLGHFHALVDYAHNPAGYEAVGSFVKNWPGPRIGVVGGPGDRRDEDLAELGQLSATFFDQIIVKEDDDNRGRPRGNAAELIVQGISQTKTDPAKPVSYSVQLDEAEAIAWALDHAPEKSLVVIFPDSVSRAISLIMSRNPVADALEGVSSEASVATESAPEPAPEPVPEPAPDSRLTQDSVLNPVSVGGNGTAGI